MKFHEGDRQHARSRKGKHATTKARWDNGAILRSEEGKYRACSAYFFFISFLDYFSAKDMFEEFQSYGDIDEVVIPSKRDIRGNQYGFVRFHRKKHLKYEVVERNMAISSVASTREYGGYSYAVMLKDKSNIDASTYRHKVGFQLEEQDL
ncbi:hypothetical protein KIW84_044759 [Lathyrus oleraceus]|uniref:RRM domain-containing protein n=1 Tax=Pisum sativum TaxID=3888 RepID=A0A9D4XJA2_PEA|nr:hypothetical protein KIW84_044759 [Pisum sativum]